MIEITALAGLLLSFYALYVMHHMDQKDYKPLCDVRDNISCTKAFGSKESSLLAMPNPMWGVLFYITVIVLNRYEPVLAIPIVATGTIVSVYLMFISYVKQRNFCLVCTATYIVNFYLLYLVA